MKGLLQKLLEQAERDAEVRGVALSRAFSVPDDVPYLNTLQLAALEKEFRDWAEKAGRRDFRASRRRMLLLFLLLRHTGMRLGEAVALNDCVDVDAEEKLVRVQSEKKGVREIPVPRSLIRELEQAGADSDLKPFAGHLFALEPAHVRKTCYAMAKAAGFDRTLGAPGILRRSRAIEMLREGMPLPVAHRLLGMADAGLPSRVMELSPSDVTRSAQYYLDRENRKKTSARNRFYGRIARINRGDIQSEVVLEALGGHVLSSVITNVSLDGLVLSEGGYATAEVKAPWVVVMRADSRPDSGAANTFAGRVISVNRGAVSTEVEVALDDESSVCSVITEESRKRLDLSPGDSAWVLFSAFSVILTP